MGLSEAWTFAPPSFTESLSTLADKKNSSFFNDSTTDMNQTECEYALQDVNCAMKQIVLPCVFGLVTLIGVVGNGLVIYVILSKAKMRTVTNLLLLNLAIADLLFVLVCPPFTAVVIVLEYWPLGSVLCKLMHYVINVSVYVTIYTLVVICVIRYMTIVHSAATMKFRTRNKIIFIAVVIWVIMLLSNVAVMTRYDLRKLDTGGHTCDLAAGDGGTLDGRIIFGNLFFVGYLLPLMLIAVFSVLIVRYISQHRQPSVDKGRSASRKKQASRLIVLVVIIFALFWLPAHVYLITSYFFDVQISENPIVPILTLSLAYCNSCVNPIIYNSASMDFRDSFREVATCSPDKKSLSGTTVANRMSIDLSHMPISRERQPLNQSAKRNSYVADV